MAKSDGSYVWFAFAVVAAILVWIVVSSGDSRQKAGAMGNAQSAVTSGSEKTTLTLELPRGQVFMYIDWPSRSHGMGGRPDQPRYVTRPRTDEDGPPRLITFWVPGDIPGSWRYELLIT